MTEQDIKKRRREAIRREHFIFRMLIILGVVSLVENIFMLPILGIYNLCHKKQFRKSYIEFFNF